MYLARFSTIHACCLSHGIELTGALACHVSEERWMRIVAFIPVNWKMDAWFIVDISARSMVCNCSACVHACGICQFRKDMIRAVYATVDARIHPLSVAQKRTNSAESLQTLEDPRHEINCFTAWLLSQPKSTTSKLNCFGKSRHASYRSLLSFANSTSSSTLAP
jgi:hypothetical protein